MLKPSLKDAIKFASFFNIDLIEQLKNYIESEDIPHVASSSSEVDEADILAENISNILELDCIGNGAYRGVYNFFDNYLVKIPLFEDAIKTSDKEMRLQEYLKRTHPELLKFLCPMLKINNYVYVVPYCEERNVPKFFKRSVLKLFENHGILLSDLDRDCQWGWHNGMFRIVDYADWTFKQDDPHRWKWGISYAKC